MDSGGRPRRQDRGLVSVLGLLLVVAALLFPAAAAAAIRHRQPPTPATAIGQPAPSSMESATGISCGNADRCWAIGFGDGPTAAIDATVNGGQTWHPETVPSSVSVLAGISCSGASECLAVGSAGSTGAVLLTVDGGTSWDPGTIPEGAAAVTAVQCPAKLHCLVLATDGMTYWSSSTDNAGGSWVRGGALPAGMSATGLYCASSLSCVVSGFTPTGPGRGAGAIATTSDGGATWTAATVPSGLGVLRTVTCAGSTCLAAGTSSTATTGFVPSVGELLTSVDGGTTWQTATVTPNHDDAFAAACPSSRTCLVAGTSWLGKTQPDPTGSIATTLNGGKSWQGAHLHYVPVGLAAVACPVVNSCEAVGGDVFVHIALPVKPPAAKGATPANRAPAGIR